MAKERKKTIMGCDWCGLPIIGEPYKYPITAPKGNWHKTCMHTLCRKLEKEAYN